jgi:hypothetical protein
MASVMEFRQPRAASIGDENVTRRSNCHQGMFDFCAVAQVLVWSPYAAATARADNSDCEDATDPKMPPCALIIANPISWNWGK